MWHCTCGAINEDVNEKCYSCGSEMKPIDLTTVEELTTTTVSKKGFKRKLRMNILGIMVVFLLVITFLAFKKIDSITYFHFGDYVTKCFATWAISLLSCELVLVIGGFLIYLLRDRKTPS